MVSISPQSYQSAARECYALSKQFQTVYNPLQVALLETSRMAGGYQAVKAWSKAYDERAAAITLVATNYARALQHFGDVLTAAGYNWACAEYKANRDLNKGAAPTLPNAVPSELPYDGNAVIGVAASGSNSHGLESEIPDLYDKVVVKIAGGEIPDGDTVKLARAATAWKTFAVSTPVFGGQARLKMVADGLERGYGTSVPQDIPYLAAHLRTMATSAGEIELAAHDLATATESHNVALSAMRADINTQFAMAVVGASVVIAAAVVLIKKPQAAAGVEAATLDTAAVAIARTIGTFFTTLSGISFTSVAVATGGLATIAGLAVLVTSMDDSSDGQGGAQDGSTTRPTDRIKEHLTDRDLDAARRELEGEVVARKPDGTPWDHVQEVRDAQQGLVNRIDQINRRLGWPKLTDAERAALEDELSEASRLLDHSEQFVPRSK
ncbi:polymorphic toxin type 28 domain-containing protein [Nocardia aurea]|uniref:polymorphic toxin type 28 domain-containing protein n=1 Tax=Nocardia aurea TaxID=2144174 RepID=UPI0033BE2B85